jgi:hypothetical protein
MADDNYRGRHRPRHRGRTSGHRKLTARLLLLGGVGRRRARSRHRVLPSPFISKSMLQFSSPSVRAAFSLETFHDERTALHYLP